MPSVYKGGVTTRKKPSIVDPHLCFHQYLLSISELFFGPSNKSKKAVFTLDFSLKDNHLLAVTMSESGRSSSRLRCDEHPLDYTEDITINILTRLPAKTVGVCKSVAKHFLKLICEPDFPRMHLNMSTRKLKYVICLYPLKHDNVSRLFIMEDGNISEHKIEHISLLGLGSKSTQKMSCFPNGLVCRVDEDYSGPMDVDIRIFNAVTRDTVVLPKGSTSTVMPKVGVAFDPISNTYKAFRFFSDSTKRADGKYKCEVYTASSKAWRTIAEEVIHPTHNIYCHFSPCYASVAGVMYWFVWSDEGPRRPASILSVDMNDNFTNIELPAELNSWSYLIEFEGCVAVVHINSELSGWNRHENSQPYLEVFKFENGEWNFRLSTMMMVDLSDVYRVNSVAALENEIFFIVQHEDETLEYIIFDFVEESFWILDDLDKELKRYFPIAFPYAESLLSPTQM